jgi:hypothetical protein
VTSIAEKKESPARRTCPLTRTFAKT